jgi:hypothetical protein
VKYIARSLTSFSVRMAHMQADKAMAKTSQIGRPCLSPAFQGTLVRKPRFWRFKTNALTTLANAKDRQSSFRWIDCSWLPQPAFEFSFGVGRACPLRSRHFPVSRSQAGHSTCRIVGLGAIFSV